jgi:hypothetical protein
MEIGASAMPHEDRSEGRFACQLTIFKTFGAVLTKHFSPVKGGKDIIKYSGVKSCGVFVAN